jgi:predicted deacylase
MKFVELYKSLLKEFQLFESVIVLVGGLHGDEPAGNIAAKSFKDREGIVVFADINKTGHRRLDNKDPNRHFDMDDSLSIEDELLKDIEALQPRLVIALHEDDSTDEVYAYCCPGMKDKLQGVLASLDLPLAKSAIGDKTDKGVITDGKLPTRGTLERALRKRDIPSCTIETPSAKMPLEERVAIHKKVVLGLLQQMEFHDRAINMLADEE